MNIEQIENNISELLKHFNKDEFIFDLLLTFGVPKASVTLLKKGQHNLSKQAGRIILKRKVFFQVETNADIHDTIDFLQKDSTTSRYSPRFIIVTDYSTLLAADTKTNETLDIQIEDLIKHYDFFLPWSGIEKHRQSSENPADRKAAEKMARLYDELLVENTIDDKVLVHDLNVFLSRLLFCFFAEDTNIFENKIFTNSIASHTQNDGSDFGFCIDKIFEVLNSKERSEYSDYLQKFPYVNGGLFAEKHWIPKFTARSRKIIIECGELNWSMINPDIFGSMMQAVVHSGDRESLGMHYTSVPNIMKVIEPLFLDDLKEEFEKNKQNKKKLQSLLNRISRIKFFDPACGSGNFLIITYKELRRLEINIIKELGVFFFSNISLSQFYGIEIDDFAHEIAKLSLYLAEHQMNIEFKSVLSNVNPTLPLKASGNIYCENATRIDWQKVCPKYENDETYVLGNPPYLGARLQNVEQKKDMEMSLGSITKFSNLDYISCWFFIGKKYISGRNAKLAFVTTNSICQGTQVALLWPNLIDGITEIGFAYTSFKWKNNAKNNAGVSVHIIGLRNISKEKKYIYDMKNKIEVGNISPFITNSPNIYIMERKTSLSSLPPITYGSMPNDGGNLILTQQEKNTIVEKYPLATSMIKRFMGAQEFMNGINKYCLWITEDTHKLAEVIPPVVERIEKTRLYRLKSKRMATNKLAITPDRFGEIRHKPTNSIIVPQTGSEKREYIPVGFLNSDTVISNAARVVYQAELWIFGLISSRMHMVWIRVVAGRLKTDMQYSNTMCYNTFPIPPITAKQKEEVNRHVYDILEERERHSENTMAQLYDPEKMPNGLREAHLGLDLAIERCYRSKPFTSDEERFEYLFKLYERMIYEESEKQLDYS